MSQQKFWPTVHVMHIIQDVITPAPIKQNITDIRPIPLQLPDDYFWYDLDVDNEEDINDLYKLLFNNYVEDTDNTMRFNYSKEFLKWALSVPNQKKEFIFGVRYDKGTKPLVAFISAIPITISLLTITYDCVEINFLCVHKKLRNLRLAPVLIREITRRVNLNGIYYALYTTGIKQSMPFATCTYYHRPLNTKKLIEIEFLGLDKKMTMANTVKLHRLSQVITNTILRPLKKEDCISACVLLNNYLQKFKLYMHFSLEEFEYWFLTNENIVVCYVLENNNQITDMLSFYILNTTLLQNSKYDSIKIVYSWYNIATTIPLHSLINDALIIAKNKGFDVYNCLDIHDNKTFFDKLKFKKGNGDLNYYMYNMSLNLMAPEDIGTVLF